MKRICLIFIVLAVVVLSAGCSSEQTMTCTKTETSSIGTMELKSVVTSKNGKISSVETTNASFDSEEVAKSFASPYEGIDNFDVTVNGKNVVIVKNITLDATSLETVKDENEADGWTCNIS